jgi:uncharacterized membrane protein
MKNNKWDVIIWLLALLPLFITWIVYNKLPDQVPMHWNFQGEIDAWYPKFPGAFILPGLVIVINALLVFIPRFDPRKDNYAKFEKQYRTFQVFFNVLFLVLQIVIVFVSLGAVFVKVDLIVKLLIAGMFVLIGNMMPKFKHNYFIGIKTPWTLANEDVWNKTHRHGGYIWFASGCVLVVLAIIPGTISAILYFAIILISALEPIVYSYMKFKQER